MILTKIKHNKKTKKHLDLIYIFFAFKGILVITLHYVNKDRKLKMPLLK